MYGFIAFQLLIALALYFVIRRHMRVDRYDEERDVPGMDTWLSIYTVDWCPFCKKLVPEVQKLLSGGVGIEQFDCVENPEMCKGVKTYPTIVLNKRGKDPEVLTERTAEEIIRRL